MLRVFICWLWGCTAPSMLFGVRSQSISLAGNEIAGFASHGDRLFVWGEDVFEINLRNGKRERIAEGRFGEGGCVLDEGLVLNAAATRELLWLRLADRKRFVIDTGVDTRDVIAADLLGHHGVLLIHKRQQVRFYDFPSSPRLEMKERWSETELYTIYTPSTEGGLLVADVDGDGLPDLLCGNYWMKSPSRFDLPWREFAIDTWNEQESSAMLKLAWSRSIRIAGQRDMQPARVAWFERAADPQQLWPAHDLVTLQGVSGALFLGKDLIVSERNSPGRVLLFREIPGGFASGIELIRTNGTIGMATRPGGGVVLIEKSKLALLRW